MSSDGPPDNGLPRVTLLADQDNAPALAFYARLGFAPSAMRVLAQAPRWRRLAGRPGESTGAPANAPEASAFFWRPFDILAELRRHSDAEEAVHHSRFAFLASLFRISCLVFPINHNNSQYVMPPICDPSGNTTTHRATTRHTRSVRESSPSLRPPRAIWSNGSIFTFTPSAQSTSPRLFFPKADPTVQLLNTAGVFAAGLPDAPDRRLAVRPHRRPGMDGRLRSSSRSS